jgi:hypothetical protein
MGGLCGGGRCGGCVKGLELSCPQLESLNINACTALQTAKLRLHCPALRTLDAAQTTPPVATELLNHPHLPAQCRLRVGPAL